MFAWWLLALGAEAKSTCRVAGDDVPIGRTSLVLVNGVEAAAQEARQAALERRDPRPTPKNGLLLVRVDRSDPDLTEDWNHVIVVRDGGVERLRSTGRPMLDGPQRPPPLSGHWSNVLVVPLPNDVRFPAEVQAIDQTAASECSWTIDARGRVAPR